MPQHACRDGSGVSGAYASPKPSPLLVHNADRRRLLRYVQPDIVRHRNLRWCKTTGRQRPDRGTMEACASDPRLPEVHRWEPVIRGTMAAPPIRADSGRSRGEDGTDSTTLSGTPRTLRRGKHRVSVKRGVVKRKIVSPPGLGLALCLPPCSLPITRPI